MRAINTYFQFCAKLAIVCSVYFFSTNALANTCETSFHLREDYQGSNGIVPKVTKYTINSLATKMYSKAKLEELLSYFRSGVYNSQKMDEVALVASPGDPALVIPQSSLSLPKFFECHQKAGWPSATDFTPVAGSGASESNKSNASIGVTVQTRQSTSKEERLKDCRNTADERNLKGNERMNFMRNCFDGSSSDNSEIANSARELIATQQRMSDNDRNQLASSVKNAPPGAKKIYLPDLGGKCLRTVDIREDGDVRGMYWYALENICSEPVKAHWCDRKVCKGTHLSWVISPGGKEQSWTSVRNDGRHPRDLKGFACQIEYRGAQVYKDPKTNKCYTWEHLTQ